MFGLLHHFVYLPKLVGVFHEKRWFSDYSVEHWDFWHLDFTFWRVYESQKHLLSDRHCQTMEDNDRNILKVPDLSRLMSAESKKRQRTHFHVFSKTRKLINKDKQPGDRRTALQDWKKCFIASRQNTLSYLFIWYTPIQCPCYKQYLCKAGLQLMITFIVESSADYFRG